MTLKQSAARIVRMNQARRIVTEATYRATVDHGLSWTEMNHILADVMMERMNLDLKHDRPARRKK